jgi:hypothetical protein
MTLLLFWDTIILLKISVIITNRYFVGKLFLISFPPFLILSQTWHRKHTSTHRDLVFNVFYPLLKMDLQQDGIKRTKSCLIDLVNVDSFQKSIQMHIYHHNDVTQQIIANSTTNILHEGNFFENKNTCTPCTETIVENCWKCRSNVLYGNSLQKLLSNPAEFTALRDGAEL